MGRELNGTGGSKTPFVALSKVPNGYFRGVLQKKATETTKVGMGQKYIYTFGATESSLPVLIKDETGQYVEANINEGSPVAVFASNLLHDKLSQATEGDKIKITFLGQEKGKRGQKYNNFRVEVED